MSGGESDCSLQCRSSGITMKTAAQELMFHSALAIRTSEISIIDRGNS